MTWQVMAAGELAATLQATRDIRKVSLWLGHASDSYLQADPTEKLEALAAIRPPALRPGKLRPPDRLIAALRPAMLDRRGNSCHECAGRRRP
jgi:hypothetical protein